ncbi:MAG: hypothetical protein IJE15_09695 [Bacteroidaceae bacterium]|nr:hypothetical protein [Bacteroidaceae bacterium]
MKLYVNKNFSGYRWFEIGELTNSPDEIALEQAKRNPDMSAIYAKLMTYDIYDYVFLADGDELILAIRGIEDSRRDAMGRQLNISAIFHERNNIAGFESLHKILLAYLSDTKQFSGWFDSLFDPQTAQLCFKAALLKKGIEKILNSHVISKRGVGGLEYNSSSIYSIASDYTTDTIVEQLGLSRNSVERAKTTIDDNKNKWLADSPDDVPPLEEENKKLRKENEELKVENERLKQEIVEKMPVLTMSTKEIIIKYKQYFIIAIALGFVLGLIL